MNEMKQYFKNSSTLLVIVAGLLVTPPAPTLAQTPGPRSTFGEIVDVRVVNVEAVVTDRSGTRVLGLTPDDFHLLVDGEERSIDFFSEFRGGNLLRDIGASPWDLAPISETQAEGTSYLVFIDDFFGLGVDRNRVLRALKDELAFLRPEDRMAIVAWDGARTQMLTSWSSSHRKLRNALQSASARPAHGLRRIVERRTILSGRFPSGAFRLIGGRRLDITERVYSEILIDQLKDATFAASSTLRGFAAPPGRKVMLLVTGGWPFAPADFVTGDPISAELEYHFQRGSEIYGPLVETANLLGYTLYPIDAPGMQTNATSGTTANLAFRQSTGIRSLDFYRETELHYSLRYLARETGGRALINGQRQEPLSLVAEDTSSFYWMGFTASRTGDGEIREIKLTLKRPGFKVRSRSGYRDLSLEKEVTMEVESALLFGYPAHSDQLAVEIGRSQNQKRKEMLVPITVRIPMSFIALLPTDDDQYSAQLEIRIAALNAQGDRSEVTTLPWNVMRTELPSGDETVEFTTSIRMRQQPHDLVIAVYDTNTGALFSFSGSVDPVS